MKPSKLLLFVTFTAVLAAAMPASSQEKLGKTHFPTSSSRRLPIAERRALFVCFTTFLSFPLPIVSPPKNVCYAASRAISSSDHT